MCLQAPSVCQQPFGTSSQVDPTSIWGQIQDLDDEGLLGEDQQSELVQMFANKEAKKEVPAWGSVAGSAVGA